MSDDLRQRVIDQIMALINYSEIPPNAITVRDLMKNGTSESTGRRMLNKLHLQGKLQKGKGPLGAMYYWPVEDDV